MVGSVSKRLSVIFLLLRIEGEWLFLAPPPFANIRFFFGFPIYFERKNTIIFITADYFVFMCNNWRVTKVICFFCFCLSSPSIFPLNRNHGDFKRSQKKGERLTKSRSPLFCWECVEHCGGLSYHNLACCTLTVVHDVFNDIYASIGWTLSAEGCTTDGEVEALND